MEWLRGKCIGRGAFGAVHVAVDKATGRVFAVKSVDVKNASAVAVACLESEIRILKRLSSPYVVAYLGDDITAASRNLHMELVPGGSVAEAAAVSGGLGEGAARDVLRRVASALHYLHDVAGVVHGDVKGRNVLAGGDGAKLADFGAARMVSDVAPGGPRGTPAWMAPEVARGGAPTPASDVWSLGCTALELLTGRRPWSELGGPGEVGELLLFIGFGGKGLQAPAWLSDSGKDFLDKCLRRDAGDRWSCEQLLRHPFLAAEPQDSVAAPAPSPRAVLDWTTSDSDSEALEGPEPGNEHEVITRAKGRVAELASNGPGMGPEWDSDVTWAADGRAHQPSPEQSVSSSNWGSAADMENNSASGAAVCRTCGGGGLCCISGDCFCCISNLGYNCGFGLGLGLRAASKSLVVSVALCTLFILSEDMFMQSMNRSCSVVRFVRFSEADLVVAVL